MNDDYIRTHCSSSINALLNIYETVQTLFGINARERDIVRRMQRECDAVCTRRFSELSKALFASANAVSALIFVSVKPE